MLNNAPANHHTLLPVIRMLEQADTDRQRDEKREIARRVKRNPDERARYLRLRRSVSWMNEHDRSRRLLPAKPLAEWRAGFDRLTRMRSMMPLDALAETVDVQCRTLSPVLLHRHALLLTQGDGVCAPHLTGDSKRDLTRAFQAVHSALRQMQDDSTVTSIAHTAHCMAKLRVTVDAVLDYETGGDHESFASFAYPDEL